MSAFATSPSALTPKSYARSSEFDSLARYMAEVSRHRMLTRQQEYDLAYQLFHSGDPAAAHALVLANLRFVVKIATEYRGYGLKLLDLIQEGNVGLMIAVKRFNPMRGYRLISYAVWWIRAQIQSFIMRTWSVVRFCSSRRQRRLFFKLRQTRAKAQAAAQSEEKVSSQTLARQLDASVAEVDAMEARLAARDFSLDSKIDGSSTLSPLEMLTSASGEPVLSQEELLNKSQRALLVQQQVDILKAQCNEKELCILQNRLLTDEPKKTLDEIGKQFDISRQRVGQIEQKLLRTLRQALQPLV